MTKQAQSLYVNKERMYYLFVDGVTPPVLVDGPGPVSLSESDVYVSISWW